MYLYGCESWLCNDIKSAISPILSALKQLLSVRNQTCTDLVLAEIEYPDTTAIVKEVQRKFIDKLTSRENFNTSSAFFALNLARQAGAGAGKYIDAVMPYESGSFRAAVYRVFRPEFLDRHLRGEPHTANLIPTSSDTLCMIKTLSTMCVPHLLEFV